MKRSIGITGGIGSGKSMVARSFEAMGYRVYYADDRAKALYNEDAALKAEVKAIFGADVYDANDELVRAKLAERVFGNKELLAKVNALVHPVVIRDYEDWLEATPDAYSLPFVLKEAAILFEAGTQTQALEGVIMVYAPKQLRIQRVCQRDRVTVQQVQARLANQWADSRKIGLSDFIIFNDCLHPLEPQIQAAIHYFSPS
jgi:dephospho-CoA kinase